MTMMTSRFPWVRASALLTLGLSLPGCATTGVMPGTYSQTGKDGAVIDIKEAPTYTASSGAGQAVTTLDKRGELSAQVVDLPRVEQERAALLAPVAAQWPHPTPRPAKVKVRMASQYQAVTYADGTIIFDLGTLDDLSGELNAQKGEALPYMESDQELQYMLAHEYAHYALAHHSKSDQVNKVRDVMKEGVGYTNTAILLSQMRYETDHGKNAFQLQDQRQTAEDISSTVGACDYVTLLIQEGITPAWNRRQEDNADALGLDLITAAGVYGQPYDAMFRKLKHQETLREKWIEEARTEAEGARDQMLSEETMLAALDGNGGVMFRSMGEGLKDGMMRKSRELFFSYVTMTHRNPQVRRDGLSKYEETVHPDIIFEDAVVTTDTLERIRRDPQFKQAKTSTIAYFNAVDARRNGRFSEAEAYFQQAYSTPFGKQGPILHEGGRIMEALGNNPRAMKRYALAINDPTPPPESFRSLARLQAYDGQFSGALATIGRGEDALKDVPYFLPSRILVAVRQQQPDTVITLYKRCKKTKRREIVPLCRSEADGLPSEGLNPLQMRDLDRKTDFSLPAFADMISN